MKRTIFFAGLLGAVAALARANQAAPEPPVIRISVDLVQIDAVVTDSSGRHVVDLRPEDFTLDEGGKRQQITHVAYVKTGAPRAGAPPVEATLVGGGATSTGRTVIFVVDDLGVSFASMNSARRALARLAEQPIAPGDRVAVLCTGQDAGTFNFITNRETLAKAAAELRYNMMSNKGATSQLPAISSSGMPDQSRSLAAGSQADFTFRRRVAFLLGAIDGLRGVPGRKAVVLLSEGFSVGHRRYDELGMRSPFDSIFGDSDVDSPLRTLTDMANRAATVVYAIDPRGLEGDAPTAADSIDARGGAATGTTALMRARWSERFDSQGTLQRLADQTGGLAVVNRNDLVGGLGAILDDQRGYYLIGYEPAAATFETRSGKPRFHSVKVHVTRPGLRVRSRAGFYGVTDDDLAKRAPAPIF